MAPPPPATALFFVLAFGSTWLMQLPALLASRHASGGELAPWSMLALLGIAGPTLAAFVANNFERGRAREVAEDLLRWRVGAGWYAAALALPGLLYAASASLFLSFGGDGAERLYPPESAHSIAALLLVPLAQELGWRGFALPRITLGRGYLRGSVLLGVLWFAWCLPTFSLLGWPAAARALALPYLVAASLAFTWLLRRTRGSLLIAVLLHLGFWLNCPLRALPATSTPLAIHTVALCALALLLVGLDRKTWRDD